MRHTFRVQAAVNFLSGDEFEEQLRLLDEAEGDTIPTGVLVWKPFEGSTVPDLLEYIDTLADRFELIHKKSLSTVQTELPRLQELMSKGLVRFCYDSSKGERIAFGTTNRELVGRMEAQKELNRVVAGIQAIMDTDSEKSPYDDMHKVLHPEPKTKKKARTPNSDVIGYYDMDKMAFRSFKKENFKFYYL